MYAWVQSDVCLGSKRKILLTYLTTSRKQAELLSELIKFKTVSALGPSNGEYTKCADFILSYVKESIPNSFLIGDRKAPVVVAEWTGEDNTLGPILLNCHYDVVPAGDLTAWDKCEPFGGEIKDGKVWGRGAQDMKCVVAQYMLALKRLADDGSFKPLRTIIFTAVPDEEIGGAGMADFLASDYYNDIVIGRMGGIALALDEGLASEDETYSVFYGERLPWWIEVTAKGNTGHGSRFIEPTAMEQIIKISQRALDFRKEQKDLLHGSGSHAGCSHAVAAAKKKTLGDVTSLNITTMQAGVDAGNGSLAKNVIPPVAKATFDIRISPHMNPDEMKDKLDGWCQECSLEDEENVGGITWGFIGHGNDYKVRGSGWGGRRRETRIK
jgi:aminoacylase